MLSIEYVTHRRGHIVEHNEYRRELRGTHQKIQEKAKGIHDELVAKRKAQGDGHTFTLITILFHPQGKTSVFATNSV
jgi:hypothetical protein